MPIILGALSALFIGISDTFGRASAKRAESISHVSTQMLVGFLTALPMTLLLDSEFLGQDLFLGACSGLVLSAGLAIVYRAMADSSSAVTAPLAGVLVALIPLCWDLANGARLSSLAGVGCIVAVISLILVTFNPGLGMDTIRRGIGLVLVGGILMGLSIIFAGETSEASGVWPAVSQRAVGFVAMATLAAHKSIPVFLRPPVLRFGIGGGITGAIGIACLIVGSQQGDLGTVSVVGATYPAVIVVLATQFDDDELHWWQAIGVLGAIAGTVLIALA